MHIPAHPPARIPTAPDDTATAALPDDRTHPTPPAAEATAAEATALGPRSGHRSGRQLPHPAQQPPPDSRRGAGGRRPAGGQADLPLAASAHPDRPRRPPARPATRLAPHAAAPSVPPDDGPTSEVTALQGRILRCLGPSPLAEDQLIRDLSLPARAVTPAITDMELAGLLRREPGGLVVLTARAGLGPPPSA
nr:hypothetical protein [Pseudooceanicola aestuarii]